MHFLNIKNSSNEVTEDARIKEKPPQELGKDRTMSQVKVDFRGSLLFWRGERTIRK